MAKEDFEGRAGRGDRMGRCPSMRWTAKQLTDYCYERGFAEHLYAAYRGGPLPKAVILHNIAKRCAP